MPSCKVHTVCICLISQEGCACIYLEMAAAAQSTCARWPWYTPPPHATQTGERASVSSLYATHCKCMTYLPGIVFMFVAFPPCKLHTVGECMTCFMEGIACAVVSRDAAAVSSRSSSSPSLVSKRF
jgi:hypothetical protein